MSKYVTIFDYIDKILIVLSATSSGVSIISFISIIGVPAGIASASFTLIFSITAGIIKKLLSTTIKKKKKHDQILMLAKSKYNSIEALISQALNDINISHKEFITILNEKDRYERMKENKKDKNKNEKQEIIKFSRKLRTTKIFFLLYIKILKITRKNCYKCDLETIINNDINISGLI